MTSELSPFHLAIPVNDLEKNRIFYRDILNCDEGRSSDRWVDFNFFGHQLVIHYQSTDLQKSDMNIVDGKNIPVPHFGVVLPWKVFQDFAKNLSAKGVQFIVEPYIRFEGQIGEQATMFFLDPSGNALEFKAFKDMEQLFAK